MENQATEDVIKSDLMALKTLRLGTVSALNYYVSILGWILKLSLVFLGVNTLLQRVMHAIGYYLPTLSLKVVLIGWLCALLVSTFMSFTAARIILIGQLIKGQLKTATLIQKKILHFTLVFFLIYSIAYLVITYPVIGWMDIEDFQRTHDDLWFSCIYIAFPQFFSFIVASSITAFISMIELDRLGLGPLFNTLRDTLRNQGYLSGKSHTEELE